jgi:type I protein arginine methyltransferase
MLRSMRGYEHLEAHRAMLGDAVRTDGFRRAIEEVVRPGDIVIDAGCGTGILSFFASRAGASRIHAIERTPIVSVARRVAATNGLTNITFLPGQPEDVEVPSGVDVLISEWMGHFVFAERMFETVILLRDRALRPGGTMLPRAITLHAALVSDKTLHEELSFYRKKPYGFDFGEVGDVLFSCPLVRNLEPDQLLEPGRPIGRLDMASWDGRIPEMRARWSATASATAYGICGWFDAELTPTIGFSTGPFAPETHWGQVVFPFRTPMKLLQGEPVELGIVSRRLGAQRKPGWEWSIRVGDTELVQDDDADDVWTDTRI